MNRPAIRRALRLARRKEGATETEIAETSAVYLVSLGLLRQVTLRVAISGAVIERRWKLTTRGEFWLDEDSSTPMLPPPIEAEDEETGT